MGASCTYMPSKGKDLFVKLKADFGYEKTVELFNVARDLEFIKDYKKHLVIDDEGFPTYESFVNIAPVRAMIGEKELLDSLQKNFTEKEGTFENYKSELSAAYIFNSSSPYNNSHIAIVEYTDKGKVKVSIKKKTDETSEIFKNQYGIHLINSALTEAFAQQGYPGADFYQAEGRVGQSIPTLDNAKKMMLNFLAIKNLKENSQPFVFDAGFVSLLINDIYKNNDFVKRSLKHLLDNPNLIKKYLGDAFDKNIPAEQQASQALISLFMDYLNAQGSIENVANIFKRTFDAIQKSISEMHHEDLLTAAENAETIGMNTQTKAIVEEATEDFEYEKEKVEYDLKDTKKEVKRNLEILKKAILTEKKRLSLSQGSLSKEKRKKIKDLISELGHYLNDDAANIGGLLLYADEATRQLSELYDKLKEVSIDSSSIFVILRDIKSYLDSFEPFISAVNLAISEDALSGSETSSLTKTININGEDVNIEQIFKNLTYLQSQLKQAYQKKAFPAFLNFIKPFLGKNAEIQVGKNKGKKITVDELLYKAEKDISVFDMWLDSMANSSDVLLQLFDAAVKEAKTKARLATIKQIKKLQEIRKKAESLGITDFEWMFEEYEDGGKTGNYISELNTGQYLRDLKEFEESMDEKYGKNPSGEDKNKRIEETAKWHAIHSMSFRDHRPHPFYYKNKKFKNLTQEQESILNELLGIKKFLDSLLPDSIKTGLKAVQIRKSLTQRILDTGLSPNKVFNEVLKSMEQSVTEQIDDDIIFGSTKVLTDFDGSEKRTLPILYTHNLENPDELSTDVISSLMLYANMAFDYSHMLEIINPLEVGRSLVINNRNTVDTKGSFQKRELFNIGDKTFSNPLFKKGTNIEKRLEAFFSAQVYHKYLKPAGGFEFMGKYFSNQKLVTQLLGVSSFVQLGFNWLSNIGNATLGIAMQNIEACANEYFSVRQLAKADKIYLKHISETFSDFVNRDTVGKLSLFNELFDIKQEFESSLYNTQKKNWIERFFGKQWAYIGQKGGDHWLYNRTAIAMALNKTVIVDGHETNLWDALTVKDFNQNNDGIKILDYSNIYEIDGTPLDVNKFSRQVAEINHKLFGIYNKEDLSAAHQVALGRLLLQYRKWMVPMLESRFQSAHYNNTLEKTDEGFYRTVFRLAIDLARGEKQLSMFWSQLEEFEKKNIRRAVAEMVQFLLIAIFANLKWPDDDDEKGADVPYFIKLLEYLTKRLFHETAALTPTPLFVTENLKTVANPIPSLGLIKPTMNVITSLIDPRCWNDELNSGPYKGHSTLYKDIMKSPIPPFPLKQKMEGIFDEDALDNKISYYARPTY